MHNSDSTPRRLLTSLRACLWAVLVLCIGTAIGSRTLEPLDLPQGKNPVLSEPAEGGCFFLRARWMDPTTGRFVSEDPFDGEETRPITQHRFLYANESPVNVTDPSGNFGLAEIGAIESIMSILSAAPQVSFGLTKHAASVDKLNNRPKFDDLWRNYLGSDYTFEDVYWMIGGKPLQNHLNNPKAFSNSCAMRLSRALNLSGNKIPTSAAGLKGRGDDGNWYFYRVEDLASYLKSLWGKPDLDNVSQTQAKLKKGVMLFKNCGNYESDGSFQSWPDASGHLDLWNGAAGNCGDHCYWSDSRPGACSMISLWELR